MPTYVFRCGTCGPVEVTQSVHAERPDRCTRCGRVEGWRRDWSASARPSVTSTPGFHATDYRRR